MKKEKKKLVSNKRHHCIKWQKKRKKILPEKQKRKNPNFDKIEKSFLLVFYMCAYAT